MKTPGKCFQKDDMEMLLPQLAAAGIWVFATPVYFDGMTAPHGKPFSAGAVLARAR